MRIDSRESRCESPVPLSRERANCVLAMVLQTRSSKGAFRELQSGSVQGNPSPTLRQPFANPSPTFSANHGVGNLEQFWGKLLRLHYGQIYVTGPWPLHKITLREFIYVMISAWGVHKVLNLLNLEEGKRPPPPRQDSASGLY